MNGQREALQMEEGAASRESGRLLEAGKDGGLDSPQNLPKEGRPADTLVSPPLRAVSHF